MAKTAWGIELGTSNVKAVKMTGDRGGVTLEDVAIISLADFPGNSPQESTAGALNELRTSKGIKKGEDVYVSISGQNTLGRIISLPPVPKERVRETIENEARSQIPIKLEEAVWDYQVIEDAASADEMRVNLYAAKKDVVNQLVDVCDSANLTITGIQVAPLGIYNFIKYEMDDAVSDVCVAIDIGADNTDVVIIDGQKTYVRVVPVAGNDITKALRARFKLSAEDAEKLKLRAHKSKDAAAVFEAMKPPLKDMVGEIYRAVGFYKNQNEEANINQLVMMGNGSKLLNIKKFFEQQLQYNVHKVDTPARIALARTVDPTEVQNNIQSLTVAIGLALQGLGLEGVNTINLIPPEYLVGQAAAKIRTPFFVAGAIAAAGGLIAMLLAIVSTGGVQTTIDAATSNAKNAGDRKAAYNKLKPADDLVFRAKSYRNLVEGIVATLPAGEGSSEESGEGGEEAPAPVAGRELTVRASVAPGLIARVTTDALARYAANNPRTAVYYANGGKQPSGAVIGANTASMLEVKSIESWTGDTEGVGGHYKAQREFTFRVWIASELDTNTTPDDANELLNRRLCGTGDDDGLLRKALHAALLAEFEATGQLKGVDAEQRKKIVFGTNIQSMVNQISANEIGNGGNILMKDIIPNASGGGLNRPGRSMPPPRQANDTKFAVSEVKVILTLNGIADPEPAAEEATE